MKRIFFVLALVCAASLPACQCDDPPEIGPVEEVSSLGVAVDLA